MRIFGKTAEGIFGGIPGRILVRIPLEIIRKPVQGDRERMTLIFPGEILERIFQEIFREVSENFWNNS